MAQASSRASERNASLPSSSSPLGRVSYDYWRHAELYWKDGVDIWMAPVIDVGTLCRRQATMRATAVLAGLKDLGCRLHGFGRKFSGLVGSKDFLASADSLAWSYGVRKKPPLPKCELEHSHCNNCIRYAQRWQKEVLRRIGEVEDDGLGEEPPLRNWMF